MIGPGAFVSKKADIKTWATIFRILQKNQSISS